MRISPYGRLACVLWLTACGDSGASGVEDSERTVEDSGTTDAGPGEGESNDERDTRVDSGIVDASPGFWNVTGTDGSAGPVPRVPEAGPPSPPRDAGMDAGTEAGSDSGRPEAGSPSPVDASPPPPDGLGFLVEPTFEGNPNPAVPQAGVVRFETSLPATYHIAVSGGGEAWLLSSSEPSLVHEKPVFGLKPGTPYEVTVTVQDEMSEVTSGPLAWTTPDLPADFPPIGVTALPDQMEPGMTLFNVREPREGYLVIVDREGVVRWYYYVADTPVREAHLRLEDGSFLFVKDRRVLLHVDALGNTRSSWHATEFPLSYQPPEGSIPVEIDSFHHEISVMPDGNLLVLSSDSRTVDDFPTSDSDPNAPTETALVVGDAIVEFTPEGEIVKHISILDLLDPTRVGRGSLGSYWSMYGGGARDWSHSNAVVYDEASDAYYLSVRHQDAVIKIDRETETLEWILGTPANWNEPWSDLLLMPVGELAWPFHQHALEWTPNGLGMYDNGNHRAAAFEPLPDATYSRAVIYDIDEETRSVSEVWNYGPLPEEPDSFYSGAMGDADWQPLTGNVLMTNADLSSSVGNRYGQILEVTPDGTRVFELDVGSPVVEDAMRYSIYRADRIEDIRQ